jgi:poly(hydroxyalkanoate) granule-associated protein
MTTKENQTEEVVEEGRNPLVDAVHKVLLASIGAVALAQEEIEDFINKLVERGEIAEKDGKAMISDLMDKRKKQTEKAEKEADSRIEDLLRRMNVPTKRDIQDLSAKITELTEKVDELAEAEKND